MSANEADLSVEIQAVRAARERLGRDLDQLNVEVRAEMGQTAEKLSWQLLSTLAAVGAAIAVRKVLTSAWSALRPEPPPENPADPETSWGEALAWTAATGLLVGVARMVAGRGAAGAWRKSTGTVPPGFRS